MKAETNDEISRRWQPSHGFLAVLRSTAFPEDDVLARIY